MKVRLCTKCNTVYSYSENDIEWQEFGTFSMKIIRCEKCGAVSILQTVEDKNIYVNTDSRFYNYKK